MKKLILKMIVLLIMLIIFLGCAFAYYIFIKEKRAQSVSTEFIFTLDTLPRVASSLSTQFYNKI